MSNRYSVAPADVQKRVKKIAKKFHEGLLKARVRIDTLLVTPEDEDDGPPITQFGAVQIAKSRIVGQRDRGAGRGDVEILIDSRQWAELTSPEQDALLDRQLYCFQVVKDKENDICTDGNGRPKLKTRRPDRVVICFDAVAERHGQFSQELIQARDLVAAKTAKGAQLYFPGMAPEPKSLPAKQGGNVIDLKQQPDKAAAK